jgi:hypothetical protein
MRHEILCENLCLQEALRAEQIYIKLHNTMMPNGYNLTTGGEYPQYSIATREKQRQQMLGNTLGLGRRASEESRKKMSDAQKGKKMSAEAIEKTRLANLGKTYSPETIAKMSLSAKNRKTSKEAVNIATIRMRIAQLEKALLGSPNSKYGLQGVKQVKSGKYCASITHKKNRIHLGTYNTIEEAQERGRQAINDCIQLYKKDLILLTE